MALENDAQKQGAALATSCEKEAKTVSQKFDAPDVRPQLEAIKNVTRPLIESNLNKTMKEHVEKGVEQRKGPDMEGPGPETLEM